MMKHKPKETLDLVIKVIKKFDPSKLIGGFLIISD